MRLCRFDPDDLEVPPPTRCCHAERSCSQSHNGRSDSMGGGAARASAQRCCSAPHSAMVKDPAGADDAPPARFLICTTSWCPDSGKECPVRAGVSQARPRNTSDTRELTTEVRIRPRHPGRLPAPSQSPSDAQSTAPVEPVQAARRSQQGGHDDASGSYRRWRPVFPEMVPRREPDRWLREGRTERFGWLPVAEWRSPTADDRPGTTR